MSKFIFAVALVAALSVCGSAQSVADAARQQPKPEKKAAKVYTNDDIPSVDTSKYSAPAKDSAKSEITSTEASKDAKTDSTAEAKADSKADAEKEASPEDRKKAEDQWKAKFAAQKQKIADLDHELQLTDREYKLRAAVFYADAGNRLRDDKKWADTERKYKDDMARLQQELTAAKQKLDDVREDARKAGYKVD